MSIREAILAAIKERGTTVYAFSRLMASEGVAHFNTIQNLLYFGRPIRTNTLEAMMKALDLEITIKIPVNFSGVNVGETGETMQAVDDDVLNQDEQDPPTVDEPAKPAEVVPEQPAKAEKKKRVKAPVLSLAEQVIAKREKLGLSRPQLAEKLGCHRDSIWKYETGKRQPSQAFMDQLNSL